jgi:twitching motility protein PilJ
MADDTQSTGATDLGQRYALLLGGAIALLLLALLLVFLAQRAQTDAARWLETAQNIPGTAQRLATVGSDINRGVAPDLMVFTTLVVDLDEQTLGLVEGDELLDLKPVPESAQAAAQAVRAIWEAMEPDVQQITRLTPEYSRGLGEAEALVEQIRGEAGLYARHASFAEELVGRGGAANAAVVLALQIAGLERIATTATQLFAAGRDPREFYPDMRREAQALVERNARLARESAGAALATAVGSELEALSATIAGLEGRVENLSPLPALASELPGNSTDLFRAASELAGELVELNERTAVLPLVSYGSVALAIVLLIAYAVLTARAVGVRIRAAESRDARQQQAILGLLDEITNLADGDLTVDVTVTEDFTGAIADSINYTVGNMRSLVGTINDTSSQLVESAESTQSLAVKMNEASERQAREITGITQAISATSQSLQQVAGRAEKLALQAEGSVSVARQGAETAERTIQGMNALREQIQDTSKRIKRLGESSQEIGNIIELINDIAEQTGTLALNASIQAAMAGEQGRGFAVVAEEVQRLAERASGATRQIENLVKTIQADTNEAIVSMERSTQNVVGGARSAEEAGGALTQVQSSSQQIAQLIQEIAAAARQQSASATQIAGQMQNIREIAVQTSRSSGQTAQAVGELNTLSDRLRSSVEGFKLPD